VRTRCGARLADNADNSVKWANQPADFPPYRRVHAFARRWQVTGAALAE
jgi:hypothetical protein